MDLYSFMISITSAGQEAAASLALFQSFCVYDAGSFFRDTTAVSTLKSSGAIDAHIPQLIHISVCSVTVIFLLYSNKSLDYLWLLLYIVFVDLRHCMNILGEYMKKRSI